MRGNALVGGKLADLFGSEEESNCQILFVLEANPAPVNKRLKLEDGSAAQIAPEPGSVLGDPLPSHTFVLRYASEWFRTKFDNDHAKQRDATSSREPDPAMELAAGTAGRPILRVPLASVEEVSSARAAIRFAYTGQMQASSIREALELQRQACYLQVHNCAVACTHHIESMLSQASNGSEPPVLELYANQHLWPSSDQEPRFASVLASTKPQLVSHFGDALATLNRPTLRQQLLALPACALEVLLESDDFGTDTEDSVLLLLATWMKQNRGSTDAATRERLCRLVRLAQLSQAYANAILPALAADFAGLASTAGGLQETPGWFAISFSQVTLFSSYTSARSDTEREGLMDAAEGFPEAWLNTAPRRQCVPEGGLGFDWYISRDELERALATEKPVEHLYATFNSTGLQTVVAFGFNWRPIVLHRPGKPSAGLFLGCHLPDAFKMGGSFLSARVFAPVQLTARVELQPREASQQACTLEFRPEADCFVVGRNYGFEDLIPLRQQVEAPRAGGQPLDAWADYRIDGRLSGKLHLLGYPEEQGDSN